MEKMLTPTHNFYKRLNTRYNSLFLSSNLLLYNYVQNNYTGQSSVEFNYVGFYFIIYIDMVDHNSILKVTKLWFIQSERYFVWTKQYMGSGNTV